MLFDTPTFVIERRINQPLADIQRGLADRTPLVPAGMIDLETDGFLCIHEPFRPVRPYSASQPVPTWCATGHLLTARRRTVAAIAIDVSMWSGNATTLSISPVEKHAQRWRRWRLRSYFTLAHLAADAAGRVVAQRAALAIEAYRNEPAIIDANHAERVFSER